MRVLCFWARSINEQHQLRSSLNFAMHKVKPSMLTRKQLERNNLCDDNVFSFMSSDKEAPTYWKQFFYDAP